MKKVITKYKGIKRDSVENFLYKILFYSICYITLKNKLMPIGIGFNIIKFKDEEQ